MQHMCCNLMPDCIKPYIIACTDVSMWLLHSYRYLSANYTCAAQHDNNHCGYLADSRLFDTHAFVILVYMYSYYMYMHLLRMCVCFLICINLCMTIIHHCTATALTAAYSPNANGLCKQFSWKLYLSTKTILAALQGPLNCNVSFSSGLVALLLWWIEFVIRCYNFGC